MFALRDSSPNLFFFIRHSSAIKVLKILCIIIANYIYIFFRTKISFKVMEFRNMLSHVRIDSRMISLTSQTLNSRVIEEDVVLERINIFYSLFSFLFLILVLGFYRIFSRISKLALIFIVQIHSCILANGFLVTSTKKHCGYKFVSFHEIFNILLHKRKYIYKSL